jgi:hypothetical protein
MVYETLFVICGIQHPRTSIYILCFVQWVLNHELVAIIFYFNVYFGLEPKHKLVDRQIEGLATYSLEPFFIVKFPMGNGKGSLFIDNVMVDMFCLI